MLADISAGFGSLKAAYDIVKGLSAASTNAAVNEVKIELTQHIIEAQHALTAANEKQTAAAERIRKLEQEIMRLKDWEREKQRYQMKRFTPGSIAYCLKPEMAEGDAPHRICPQCYQDSKKGFLQSTGEVRGRGTLHRCTSCRAEVVLGSEMRDQAPPEVPPEPTPARPSKPYDYDPYAELHDGD